ncbi:hypothetical protein [Streptomyces corynorhini]|uniref:YkuD domain-containing protein n=1 Tax=Streptomyces corynorhini TaxID=2282652 RepID=A0A370AY62_9ACTN|nr:hypothetical protein [Streptomyces corynorhini]RDG32416.1 hypothetical protein DVH02_32470 [Streptomyces corynorhini]
MSVCSVRTVRRGPLAAVLLTAGLLLTGCGGVGDDTRTADKAGSAPGGTAVSDKDAVGAESGSGGGSGGGGGSGIPGMAGAGARAVVPQEIPGLGRKTRAEISPETTQAVVVTGADRDSSDSSVQVYERDPVAGWAPVTDPWPAHNAKSGWTDDHDQGDLRSPIGVFTLTDAGGLLDDPGTKLTYDQGPAFTASGQGVDGEPLEGAFDYVVAIDYNRVPGTSPLDWTRPLGMEKGGGIWMHVDHDGPTQACVSIHRDRMRELLLLLDPEKRPVVVMGDAESLSH